MIWKKNLIIQLAISITAIIIIVGVVYFESQLTFSELTSNVIQNDIDIMCDSLNYRLSWVKQSILNIVIDEKVQQALSVQGKDEKEIAQLESYYQSQYGFYEVRLYFPGTQDTRAEDMIEETLANNGRFLVFWNTTLENEYIQLSKTIYDVTDYDEILGVISVKISPNYITSLFPVSAYSDMYAIIDGNNQICYSPSYIKSDIVQLLDPDSEQNGNHTYNLFYSKVPGLDWQIVAISSKSIIQESNRKIFYAVCAVSVFLILAIGIANYTASVGLFRSTKILVNNINDYTKNGCSVDALTSEYLKKEKGEIGQLYQSFLQMAGTIDHLIDQVYMTEIRKRDAELSALQAQINPHFLYNTLDSIKWLADQYEAYDIENIVENLAAMMRFSLNHGSNIITIRNELQQVRAYMEIQKVRYKNMIEYEIDVSEDLYDMNIIKLILQPLVENSFLHGFEDSGNVGTITIRIKRIENALKFSVINDGTLIDLEKVEQILKSSPYEQSKGYGIRNVQMRLVTQYGEGAALHYRIVDGKTIVSFQIPVL